jgi:hypothetical protein
VRAAHHHRHAGRARRVGHPVCLRDHSGHRSDANQPNLLLTHEPGEVPFVQSLRIAVNQ